MNQATPLELTKDVMRHVEGNLKWKRIRLGK
jgi:hypothetical protein